MMRFDRAEKYRAPHPGDFCHEIGDRFGWFIIPTNHDALYAEEPVYGYGRLRVQASDDFDGWEHVSVSLIDRTPTWAEMCRIKGLFWDEEDTVVQFHPPKSEYVNCHPYCLHLWRWTGGEFPRPSSTLVGPK
jgi:hypothetical protein